MKNRLISLMLIGLFSLTTAGCSIVRVMQTQAGVAVEKASSTVEERKIDLQKKDFRLGFNATEGRLGVRLEYRPYHNLEKREIVTYRPGSDGRSLEMLIGTVSFLGALAWTLSDVLVETGQVAINDEGELYNVTEFDWSKVSPLQAAALAGVSLDFIIWTYHATEYQVTVQEPWKSSGEVVGEWQSLKKHRYRIELPTYDFGKDYTSKTGDENILVTDFLTGIRNPASFMDIDSVSVRASTEFEGKAYEKELVFTTQAQLQSFQDIALAARGIDMISTGKPRLMPRPEADFRWHKDPLQAGKDATLWVTVRNTGKGVLYRLTALTISQDPAFNNREIKFGKIEPGDSRAVPVSFSVDKLKRTQDIPMRIRFAEYNGHVPPNIEPILRVFENPRPKFDYAYRVIDGGTDNSVGNSDGIFQYGESADVQVAIRNSGKGKATDVIAQVELLDNAGCDLYGDTSVDLQTLDSGDTRLAIFNVGVKSNAPTNTLRLKLSIQENNFGAETNLTDTIRLPISQVPAPKVKVLNLSARITSRSAQVYNGASEATPIIAEIPQDSWVPVSGRLDEWYRVELNIRDQKAMGWVHKEQLRTVDTVLEGDLSTEEPVVVEVFQNTPPTLTLLKPAKHEIVVEEGEIELLVHAVGNKGIKNVVLTVNRENGKKETYRAQGHSKTFDEIKRTVSLNYGKNTIALNAYDTNNQVSEPIVLSVTREREEIRNDYALLLAVNSYEHFDPWHKLNNPISDAEAVGRELKNRYGFTVEVVSDPSRDDILAKINQYAQKRYNENDQLLIFFAGHGYYEEINNAGMGYLVASDTLPPEADPGKSSYISHGALRQRIDSIGCEHIFLMVDACFSRTLDAPVDQFNRARGTNGIPDDVTKRQFIKQSLAHKTRWYLTSGGKEYVSDGRPNRHSPFTRRVLDALRSSGRGQHGILTLEDIGRYIEKVTPQPRAGEFGRNAPGSNFLFIRSK